MASGGYILVYRELFDHELFAPEPYTEREAWLWLIKEAAWKSGSVRTKAGPRNVERGELISSTRFMAKRWRWSEARVRRFLRRLILASMVVTLTDKNSTHITICNYDTYQDMRRNSDATPTQ